MTKWTVKCLYQHKGSLIAHVSWIALPWVLSQSSDLQFKNKFMQGFVCCVGAKGVLQLHLMELNRTSPWKSWAVLFDCFIN